MKGAPPHRKTLLAAALLSACAIFPSLPATGDTAEENRNLAKWRLAGLAASREIMDLVEHPGPLAESERILLVEHLSQSMRTDVAAHSRRDASYAMSLDTLTKLLQASQQTRIATILEKASSLTTRPVDAPMVAEVLGPDWPDRRDKALRAMAACQLPALYPDARQSALARQRHELEQRYRYPTPEETESLLEQAVGHHPNSLPLVAEDLAPLQHQIADLVQPDHHPLFEELSGSFEERVRQLAETLRQQYAAQLQALDAAQTRIPENRRRAEAIASAWQDELEAELARHPTRSRALDESGMPVPQYPLAGVIRSALPRLATAMQEARLTQYLHTTPLMEIPETRLATEISANLAAHHTLAQSETLLASQLVPPLQAVVVEAYAKGAFPPGQESSFSALVATNPVLAGEFRARLTRELHKSLVKARTTLGEAQYRQSFTESETKAPLPADSLSSLQDKGNTPLRDLPSALRLLGRHLAMNDPLLEETEARIIALANLKATEGFDVLATQSTLLKQLETEHLDQLRQDVAAHRPVTELLARWTKDLEAGWTADNRSRSTPYPELLDLTRANLNKTVRQLYDSLQDAPAAARASALTASPAAGSPGESNQTDAATTIPSKAEEQEANRKQETPPPEPQPQKEPAPTEDQNDAKAADKPVEIIRAKLVADRRNAPDAVLILSEAGGKSSVARLITLAESGTQDITFFAPRPEEASQALFESLKPHLERLWEGTVDHWKQAHSGLGFLRRKTPPRMKLLIVIQSDEVRHRMSLLLRERIEKSFAEWREKSTPEVPAMELDWKVGLTLDLDAATR